MRTGRGKEPSIEATLSPEACVTNYFAQIEPFIMRNLEAFDQKERIDYFKLKRFMSTAFNNLHNLDGRLYYDNELQDLRQTLKIGELIYTDLETKMRHTKFCFEVVFLGQQPEFIQNEQFRDYARRRIKSLQTLGEQISPIIEAVDAKNLKELNSEAKRVKTEYVDTLHERANLGEKLRQFTHLRDLYTNLYYAAFTDAFKLKAVKYKELAKRILDAKVLTLDRLLWKKAATSKSVQAFFDKAQITGGYSTKVYLRYYLKALDRSKMNPEQYALEDLLHYLESLPTNIENFAV